MKKPFNILFFLKIKHDSCRMYQKGNLKFNCKVIRKDLKNKGFGILSSYFFSKKDENMIFSDKTGIIYLKK